MACKYVKEFDFGPQKTYVKGYARGGAASCGMAQGGKVSPAKVARTMHEFKAGELHSGSKIGPVVKSRDQAVAIALSQARAKRK
jgi:hypothetical protein